MSVCLFPCVLWLSCYQPSKSSVWLCNSFLYFSFCVCRVSASSCAPTFASPLHNLWTVPSRTTNSFTVSRFLRLYSHERESNCSGWTLLLQPHHRSLTANGLTAFWAGDNSYLISGYLESCDMSYGHPRLWMGRFSTRCVDVWEMPCIPQPPWFSMKVP